MTKNHFILLTEGDGYQNKDITISAQKALQFFILWDKMSFIPGRLQMLGLILSVWDYLRRQRSWSLRKNT